MILSLHAPADQRSDGSAKTEFVGFSLKLTLYGGAGHATELPVSGMSARWQPRAESIPFLGRPARVVSPLLGTVAHAPAGNRQSGGYQQIKMSEDHADPGE